MKVVHRIFYCRPKSKISAGMVASGLEHVFQLYTEGQVLKLVPTFN